MMPGRGDQPVLPGAKVLLRPWTPDDANFVFAACQDPEIQRWTTVPSPYSLDDAIAYVTHVARDAWDNGGAVFAVVEAATGGVAGSIGSHEMRAGVAHVGYWTAPAARGRGLTADALRTLSHWFLREAGAARVELVAQPENAASIRVAESAGFIAEGVLRQRIAFEGRRADVVMYSLLRDDLPG